MYSKCVYVTKRNNGGCGIEYNPKISVYFSDNNFVLFSVCIMCIEYGKYKQFYQNFVSFFLLMKTLSYKKEQAVNWASTGYDPCIAPSPKASAPFVRFVRSSLLFSVPPWRDSS